MNANHLKLVVAAGVCVAGLAALIFALRGGPSKPRSHGGLTVAANIQVAREAVLTTPKSSEDVAETLGAFAAQLRVECSRLPPELAIPSEQTDAFVSLCTERLRLVMEPDYQRYLEHVRQLTGREIGPDGSGAFYSDRKTWETYALGFRWLPIDVGAVQVRVRWKDGREVDGIGGGHTTGVGDHKKYYSRVGDDPLGSRNSRADVYDVRVPVEVTDLRTESKLRAFLIITLRKSPDEPRWMPQFMGINDPTGRETTLPPLWL